MKYLFSLTAICIIAFTACKKDEFNPTITIMSPTTDQMVDHMDTLHIHATIDGAEDLHEWGIEVVKQSDNSVVYTASDHDHAETITIHEEWVNDLMDHADLQLIVRAQDHSGTEVSTSVDFHAHH